MSIRSGFILIIFACLFTSCGPDYLYQQDYDIPANEWTYTDQLNFSFEIDDTYSIYNLWLEVEHSTDYSFQNLYTKVQTQFPSGEKLEEPLSIELADKLGRWYGDCSSNTCTLLVPIQRGAFFEEPGNYQITIEQFMRQDPIRGIRRVGFLVEKTEATR